MPNTKKARAVKIPEHWSEAKTEAEEAAWWDANAERLTREAAARGALKMGTLQQLLAEMKKTAKQEETRLLSLRVPISDIALARAQAEEKGLKYQPYLKSLLHQALVQERESLDQAIGALDEQQRAAIERRRGRGRPRANSPGATNVRLSRAPNRRK